MTMRWMRARAALAVLAVCWALPAAATERPAEVAVLSTLHQMHAEVPGYGFEDLAAAIERLQPDVLCVELRDADLAERGPQRVKQEYPRAIQPLIDARDYRVYALEPPEPTYGRIVGPYAAAQAAFREERPEDADAFGRFGDGIYAGLQAHWTSAARVNDPVTDAAMRAKHALQEAMIGDGEREGWQAWNRHFLDVVLRAAAENPGRRIVVTVGVEHGYWLRDALAKAPGVDLLDTAAMLEGEAAAAGAAGPD